MSRTTYRHFNELAQILEHSGQAHLANTTLKLKTPRLADRVSAIMKAVEAGTLSYRQLNSILDNTREYGFTPEQLSLIEQEFLRRRESMVRINSIIRCECTVDWWSRPRD